MPIVFHCSFYTPLDGSNGSRWRVNEQNHHHLNLTREEKTWEIPGNPSPNASLPNTTKPRSNFPLFPHCAGNWVVALQVEVVEIRLIPREVPLQRGTGSPIRFIAKRLLKIRRESELAPRTVPKDRRQVVCFLKSLERLRHEQRLVSSLPQHRLCLCTPYGNHEQHCHNQNRPAMLQRTCPGPRPFQSGWLEDGQERRTLLGNS